MRFPSQFLFACILIALVIAPARANDTSAELATGGLIFVQNDAIEMRAEDLFLSTKQVRVRYVFVNKSDKDVTILVAFPLPEVRISSPDDNISLPTEDPVNIFAFSTQVNGKPVTTKVEQRAIALGIDRTQYLLSLGIPLAPQLQSTNEALDRLPPDKWDELIRLGLAEIDEYDVGKGMQKHLEARWGLHTTYYWEQTFPAGKETVIEHQYKPSVGASVQTSLGSPSSTAESWYKDYLAKYCIDKDFLTTLERLRQATKSEYGPPYGEERIDYILKTGANWSGPIGSFQLTVDKGEPDNLVSFCGEEVMKISPTQFEVKKMNFVPEGDLAVLILHEIPKQ